MSTKNARKQKAAKAQHTATHEDAEHTEQGKDRVHLALVHGYIIHARARDVKGVRGKTSKT